jgi:hypothetical protein
MAILAAHAHASASSPFTCRIGHHALARERAVAVHDHGHDHLALGVVDEALLAAAAAEHDGVDELEVRRVRREHHAELLPRGGGVLVRVAHVVLHVAAAGGEGRGPRLVELGEDLLQVLADDVGEHVQAAAMGHAEHELLHAERGARLEDLVEDGNERLAALEAEALLAHVAVGEEGLEAVGLKQLGEDAALGLGAELRCVARGLKALGEPGAAVGGADVEILDAHRAAVGRLEAGDDLAERRRVGERQRAGVERLRECAVVEADRLERELVGEGARGAERVELRREVTERAVAVDELVDLALGLDRRVRLVRARRRVEGTLDRRRRRRRRRLRSGCRGCGRRARRRFGRGRLEGEPELESAEEVQPLV